MRASCCFIILCFALTFELHKTKTTLGFCGDEETLTKRGKKGWMEEGFELRIRGEESIQKSAFSTLYD